MEKISDYGTYTDGMRKSMVDKTWFLGKIDGTEEIVDYGCADGALLRYIADAMPGVFKLVGIDNDANMLQLAKDNLPRSVELITPDQFNGLSRNNHRTCLNCGSVIHEVYSYGTEESINKFWDFAFNSGFKYISIRDMAMSRIDISAPKSAVNEAIDKILSEGSLDVYNQLCEYRDFLSLRCFTMTWKSIVHFLLKYRYTTNWDREMRENYFPLLTEEILLKIPENYRVKYYEHYTLPFLKDKVIEDFGIELTTKTHYKLLLERIEG